MKTRHGSCGTLRSSSRTGSPQDACFIPYQTTVDAVSRIQPTMRQNQHWLRRHDHRRRNPDDEPESRKRKPVSIIFRQNFHHEHPWGTSEHQPSSGTAKALQTTSTDVPTHFGKLSTINTRGAPPNTSSPRHDKDAPSYVHRLPHPLWDPPFNEGVTTRLGSICVCLEFGGVSDVAPVAMKKYHITASNGHQLK